MGLTQATLNNVPGTSKSAGNVVALPAVSAAALLEDILG
jgi:hypothetical protein